jgi:uncharacterized protein (TIGR03086 family)
MSPDPVAILERRYEELGKLVAGMAPDQLDRPTPNPGWDVRALLNHVYGGLAMFSQAGTGTAVTHDDPGDVLGRDPAATLAGLVRENLDAWRRPGAMQTDCLLPLGTLPGSAAALLNAVEVAAHTWDLAQALAVVTPMDEDTAEHLLAFAGTLPLDDLRAAGELGPEVSLPSGAPWAHRLLAISGRNPT